MASLKPSDVIREYLRERVQRAGGQAPVAKARGVAQQQLSAALQGRRGVLLKHLDRLLQADGAEPDVLLRDLARTARRLRAR
jgi:hypothetical protein